MKNNVLKDNIDEILITEEELQQRIKEMGEEISAAYEDDEELS